MRRCKFKIIFLQGSGFTISVQAVIDLCRRNAFRSNEFFYQSILRQQSVCALISVLKNGFPVCCEPTRPRCATGVRFMDTPREPFSVVCGEVVWHGFEQRKLNIFAPRYLMQLN